MISEMGNWIKSKVSAWLPRICNDVISGNTQFVACSTAGTIISTRSKYYGANEAAFIFQSYQSNALSFSCLESSGDEEAILFR